MPRVRHLRSVVAVVTCAALAGCVASGDPGASGVPSASTAPASAAPASTAPASATPTPTPDPSPSADGALAVGRLTLTYRGEGGAVVVDRPDDHSHRLTLDDATHPAAVVVTVPPGTLARSLPDGSALLTQDGETVLGLGASTWHRLEVTGAEIRLATLPEVSARSGRPPELWLGSEPVLSTDWGQREGGLSIAVVPAAWARTGQAGTAAVWTWLQANEPDATGPGMQDQLECHAFGAAAKPSWNLEPWRPDIGLAGVMLAACNPT